MKHTRSDDEIIGYDTSASAYDLSVVCAECADKHGDGGGSAVTEVLK